MLGCAGGLGPGKGATAGSMLGISTETHHPLRELSSRVRAEEGRSQTLLPSLFGGLVSPDAESTGSSQLFEVTVPRIVGALRVVAAVLVQQLLAVRGYGQYRLQVTVGHLIHAVSWPAF